MKKIVLLTGLTCLALLWVIMIPSASADLVIYYSFDQLDGNTVPDMSGNGHPGAINGDVTLAGGKYGSAAKFANGGYLDLDGENFPTDEVPTDEATVCA
jgi:hypothetical protein